MSCEEVAVAGVIYSPDRLISNLLLDVVEQIL